MNDMIYDKTNTKCRFSLKAGTAPIKYQEVRQGDFPLR